jgi:hypothetical protein
MHKKHYWVGGGGGIHFAGIPDHTSSKMLCVCLIVYFVIAVVSVIIVIVVIIIIIIVIITGCFVGAVSQ